MPRRPSLRETIYGIAIGVATYTVLRIIDGLISNSAYNFAVWAKDQIAKSGTANLWPWILTLIVSSIALTETFILWSWSGTLKNELATTDNMVDLDDSLLRLLAILVRTHNSEGALRNILEELLRGAIRTLPREDIRATILLPNSRGPNEEYLCIRASYMMPAESITRTRFYIGDDENRELERGTVGLAYRDHQLRVGHINDHWECDDRNFINFDRSRSLPPYHSFVNVPIIGPSRGGAISCLGVLCFDSPNKKVFNSPQVQRLLLAFARRAASVLSINVQISQLRGQTRH